MKDIWLAQDPENGHIVIQSREFERLDFPAGIRGEGWPVQRTVVDPDQYESFLRGELDDEVFLEELWFSVREVSDNGSSTI